MDDARPVWDSSRVLAASNAWVWIPEGTTVTRTDRYLVVDRPSYFGMLPSVRVLANVLTRDTDPAALVDEIGARMASAGRTRLSWLVSAATEPADLEAELVRRGGTVSERTDVLGLPLTDGLPDLDVPVDVVVTEVTDETELRAAHTVSGDAFGDPTLTDDQVAAELAEMRGSRPDAHVGRVIARVDGRPAGTGGFTVTDGVCRLWGGSTHTGLRGRGAYRAVLLERLRLGRGRGATLGLVHGRVDTSSPILRRAGFVRYGENREIVLDSA